VPALSRPEDVRLYPFRLSFQDSWAFFPFIMDGAALPAGGALSSRDAGTALKEEIPQARDRFCRALGLDPRLVFSCTQVHGQGLVVVDRFAQNNAPEGDGILTSDREARLSVTVADCLPVFLHDTERGVFALAHSGWKGTGISLAALGLMRGKWGSRAEAVAAILGPCIRSCCYRVPEERARSFEARFGAGGGAFPLGPAARKDQDGWYLDLQAANARLLAGAGVRNIAVCQDCTASDLRLGSFRREGEAYTRMFALCPVYRGGAR
jgi:YfiH family protein